MIDFNALLIVCDLLYKGIIIENIKLHYPFIFLKIASNCKIFPDFESE